MTEPDFLSTTRAFYDAFQVGDEPLCLGQPFGHRVSLDFQRRRRPDRVAELLRDAGPVIGAWFLREPDEGVETTQQAYLLARKPDDGCRS